jgi:hypothetical protein
LRTIDAAEWHFVRGHVPLLRWRRSFSAAGGHSQPHPLRGKQMIVRPQYFPKRLLITWLFPIEICGPRRRVPSVRWQAGSRTISAALRCEALITPVVSGRSHASLMLFGDYAIAIHSF